MSTAPTPVEIEYRESDGKSMGETDLHRYWIMRLIDTLQYRYHEQRVYVSGDLLVYYEEGGPRKFIVPDVFVVKDCDPAMRRIYKVWEEPSPPQIVFEVTSASSRREDSVFKPRIYAEIGVLEYFVYDPTSDYLKPPLRGFRRVDAETEGFSPIEPDADGWLISEHFDLKVRLSGHALSLADSATGMPLLTAGESERLARQAEQAAREKAEAEVQRLRDELRRSGGEP